MSYETMFLIALLTTLILEIPLLFVGLRLFFKNDFKTLQTKNILFVGIIASFSTLPYLWFILPHYHPVRGLCVWGDEFLIFLTEGIIYFFALKLDIRKALFMSFFCNSISYLIGEMSFKTILRGLDFI